MTDLRPARPRRNGTADAGSEIADMRALLHAQRTAIADLTNRVEELNELVWAVLDRVADLTREVQAARVPPRSSRTRQGAPSSPPVSPEQEAEPAPARTRRRARVAGA